MASGAALDTKNPTPEPAMQSKSGFGMLASSSQTARSNIPGSSFKLNSRPGIPAVQHPSSPAPQWPSARFDLGLELQKLRIQLVGCMPAGLRSSCMRFRRGRTSEPKSQPTEAQAEHCVENIPLIQSPGTKRSARSVPHWWLAAPT